VVGVRGASVACKKREASFGECLFSVKFAKFAAKFVSFTLGSAIWELNEMFLKNGCRYCLEVHY
jgi:hypothetical protein